MSFHCVRGGKAHFHKRIQWKPKSESNFRVSMLGRTVSRSPGEKNSAEQATYHGLIDQLYPFLKIIEKFFLVMVVAICIPGHCREAAFVWGYFTFGYSKHGLATVSHVCWSITGSNCSKEAFASMVKTLVNLEDQPQKFERFATALNKTVNTPVGNTEIGLHPLICSSA